MTIVIANTVYKSSDVIKAVRKETHLTQQQLGDITGVSKSTVSRMERLNSTPDKKVLNAIIYKIDGLSDDVKELLRAFTAVPENPTMHNFPYRFRTIPYNLGGE